MSQRMKQMGRINALREAVIKSLKSALPDVRDCESQFGRFNLEELETQMLVAPAIRVAVLESRLTSVSNGQQSADLHLGAFIVTTGKERDVHSWLLAEAIAVLCHSGQLWGLTHLGAPREVQIEPVISAAIKQRGVAISVVEWHQDLYHLGHDIFCYESKQLKKGLICLEDEGV
ncbi:hypothetical protein [Bartonella machadoae]|uniref:hypothetical protein n=1 Tax=Bartonella machadoae TaxID=2893471 RepID=UPI001F4C86F6|nr:hypothetical protein [Bartonella machadoae]UNE53512.1 hypothetical protein LNM86_07485 [Bartonella machadoae]UNE54174.1 hypothetical protein LNM86_11715 [Bartonella machadoae]